MCTATETVPAAVQRHGPQPASCGNQVFDLEDQQPQGQVPPSSLRAFQRALWLQGGRGGGPGAPGGSGGRRRFPASRPNKQYDRDKFLQVSA